jgi:hypothetical protein
MSETTEKLEAPRGTPGRARATLAQIRAMRSQRLDESDPERIVRMGMVWNRQVWRKVSGSGLAAIFEMEGGEQ